MLIKKKEWFFLVILPLLLVWCTDQVTKYLFLDFTGTQLFGPIGFTLHYNPGAIFGFFSNLPPILRVVSLSTSGGFLVFIFIVIQIFLPLKVPYLRVGMSILLGGILGNITDRIYWGHVIDFVFISASSYNSPIFNLADLLQWVGYIIIFYGFLTEGKDLWPESNLRQSYWIDKRYQIRYCLRLVLFGGAFSIIAGIYSYTFLKVSLGQIESSHLAQATQLEVDKVLITFLIIYCFVSIAFMVILFFSGIAISHRVAGPIYAFQRFLEDLSIGKISSLKLRATDEFIHLEKTANRFVNKFAYLFQQEKEKKESLEPLDKSDEVKKIEKDSLSQ